MMETIQDIIARYPDPAPDYTTIAHLKAALVERTGLPGVASVYGGRHLVYRHFLGFGTEAQRAAWSGKSLAVAISEPSVGAHPKRLTTRAEPDGDHVRINGQKAWVSNGPTADAIIVFAITAEEQGRKRYTAFIVPRDTEGLKIEDMPGFHALRPSKHCLLTLDNCRVPSTAALGEPGSAYDRMALPFRDIEDAVGTFATLGALRHAIALFAGTVTDPEDLGAIVALTKVFDAAANAVVAALDTGHLRSGDATLVGLRVLAIDIVSRLRALLLPGEDPRSILPPSGRDADGPSAVLAGQPLGHLLSDLDATLNIARGPRLARQIHLGEAALKTPALKGSRRDPSDIIR